MSDTASSGTAGPGRTPLRRSRTDRKVAGVAGGLARHLDVDPLLVRIAFVVLTLCGAGIGVLLYLACVLLVPDEGTDVSDAQYFVDRHGRVLAAAAAVVVVLALVGTTSPWAHWARPGPWRLVAVLAVLGVLWAVRRDRREHATAVGPAPTATAGPYEASPYAAQASATAPASTPAPAFPTTAYATTRYATTPYATTPYAATPYATTPYAADLGPGTGAAARPSVAAPRRRREPSALGPLTVGTALLVAGVLVAVDRGGAVSVPAVVVLASALAVVGCGLVLGGFVGRSRGLVVLGVLLALATAVAGVVHLPGDTRAGPVTWAPDGAAQVAPLYRWGAGSARLDLTAVQGTTTVSTRAELGVGRVEVVVPRDATVRLHAHVGAGAVTTRSVDGTPTTTGGVGRDVVTTLPPPSRERAGPTLVLDVSVGAGVVEVDRAAT